VSDGGKKKKSSAGKKKSGASKSKKKTSEKKSAKPSFLKRLLKRDSDTKRSATSAAKGAEKKKPLSPLERSIAEIRQLQKVGERDPERLATLLAKILAKEKQKKDEAQEKFDTMVWDIVNKDEDVGDETERDEDVSGSGGTAGDDGAAEGGSESPPGPNPN